MTLAQPREILSRTELNEFYESQLAVFHLWIIWWKSFVFQLKKINGKFKEKHLEVATGSDGNWNEWQRIIWIWMWCGNERMNPIVFKWLSGGFNLNYLDIFHISIVITVDIWKMMEEHLQLRWSSWWRMLMSEAFSNEMWLNDINRFIQFTR